MRTERKPLEQLERASEKKRSEKSFSFEGYTERMDGHGEVKNTRKYMVQCADKHWTSKMAVKLSFHPVKEIISQLRDMGMWGCRTH